METELDGRAATGGGDDVELGPDLLGPAPHVAQAQAGRGLGGVEPASVVADPHDNDAADRPGLEPEAAGLRVSLTAFQEASMKTLCAAGTSAGLKNANGTLKAWCVWMPKYSSNLLRRWRR